VRRDSVSRTGSSATVRLEACHENGRRVAAPAVDQISDW
jgi:hypothetical protein